MKRFILLFALILFSCSADDNDECAERTAQLKEMYEPIFENENTTDQQRKEAMLEYTRKIEEACGVN